LQIADCFFLMGKAPSFRPSDLREQFGNIDIYLFDQLQKDRITPGMTVLDAGCGGGRNLMYLMRSGFTVFGVDGSADAIRAIRSLAAEVAPDLPPDNFKVAQVDALPFPDAEFNVVVCNAVLHFARDEAHFRSLLNEVWRVLAPRGLFFSRLASSIGIEDKIQSIEGRRYRLPDGSDRFLVDEEMLMSLTRELGGELLDPIKTTVVQGQRSMTTWVMRRSER
jgi:SAM-dependent methyltransferase